MKKLLLAFVISILSHNFCFANQLIEGPLTIQNSPRIVIAEPHIVIAPKPLVRTIEWVLTPQVNTVVVPEIRRGLFGRQYIVNKNELVTTWVYVPVEVWK
jgi:hypothetical protein